MLTLLSFSRFRTLGSSLSWSCPPCCIYASSGDPIPINTTTFSSDSSSLYTSTAQSSPSGPLCQCSTPTPSSPSNLLFSFRQLRIFSLCTLTTTSCFWLFLYTSCFFFSSLTLSGFLNGMLGVSEPGALIYLNLSSSLRIHRFSVLRSDCTHSRSSIFSTDVTHASDNIIIFIRQGLSFSEFSTSSLSSPDLYSVYVGVNISLNDSSSLSFLNAYSSPIRSSPKDSRTDFFLPPFFPPSQITSFWRIVITFSPTGTQKVLLAPVGRKYSIVSSPLTSSKTLTYLFFYIAPLANYFSPDISFAPSSLASGRSFRT